MVHGGVERIGAKVQTTWALGFPLDDNVLRERKLRFVAPGALHLHAVLVNIDAASWARDAN